MNPVRINALETWITMRIKRLSCEYVARDMHGISAGN